MQDPILQDISKIEQQLDALHSEGASLRTLQQQHEKDIADRKSRVEAEYASTLASLAEKDKLAESEYQQQMACGADAEDQAEIDYRSAVTKSSDAIRAKYDAISWRDREYIADLEDKCMIAAKNSEKLLKKYGTIPNISTAKPDLTALFTLFDKIMTDTAESFIKRTLKKDGFYAQDVMVQDFIKGAALAIAYLNYEINTLIPQNCNAEIMAAMNAAQTARQGTLSSAASYKAAAGQKKSMQLNANEQNRKDAALKRQRDLSDIKRAEQKYIAEEQAKITDARKRKDAFFEKELVTRFTYRTMEVLKDSGAVEMDWRTYAADRVPSMHFAWGTILVPLHTDSKPLQNLLSQKIPAYCKGGYFSVPLLMRTRSVSKAYVQYDASTKSSVYGNIQAFILQKMRSNPANHLQVYFADPNDRGQNLGVLIAANEDNESIGIYMQNTRDGIRGILKEIVDHIDSLNGELGGCASLFEYNQKSGKKKKETVLVLCDVQNCIEQDTIALLKVIWENAGRCGINVFITSQSTVERLGVYYPNIKMDWSFIKSSDMCQIGYTSNRKQIEGPGYRYAYEVSPVKPYHQVFLSAYRENYKDSLKINNLFTALRHKLTVSELSEDQKRYGKAFNGIRLPIMIDTAQNTICQDFVIGTENSQHTLITGGTGSGKSRFLQMIISSIIMNYHPDDVELWLIDCKKVEFKKFLDLRPQHIRLVSLERTQDFTYAFFDHLLEFANRRTKLFMENGVTNIKDYRRVKNDPYCMPRVVIIIDEFHAITASVNMDLKYRQLLEDALAEYRNLGISFIFSDQSVSGLKGLTDKGRQQLHNRVAMKNSVAEMKETLQLLRDNYSPETLLQMEKSEGYGDFWWSRNPNVRYKNIFIDDKTEESLIREVISRRQTARQDTKIILVDGNERSRFDERMVRERLLSNAVSSYRASALQFYVGTPTTLDEMFSFGLTQKYNNNILITGRDTRMTVDVIASIIRSANIVGDTRVVLLADCADDRYQVLRQNISLIDQTDSIEIYDNYNDICRLIAQLHAAVKSKRPFDKKVLVIWLGMTDMYDEFCVSPEKPAGLAAGTGTNKAKENGGFVVEDISKVLHDPKLLEIANGLGISVEEALEYVSEQEDTQSGGTQTDELCYNATQDVYDLFAMGGKFGLFHVVSLEYSNDARRTKGLNTDNFIHKIAFCMSRDESVQWGFRSAAAELTEGLTALYTDGITQSVFRPYITIQ